MHEEDTMQELVDAIVKNDSDKVERIIKEYPSLANESFGGEKYTPLLWAIYHSEEYWKTLLICDILIKQGADMYAALKALVERNDSTDAHFLEIVAATDQNGNSPLHIAIENKDMALAYRLLKLDNEIFREFNKENVAKQKPFHYAFQYLDVKNQEHQQLFIRLKRNGFIPRNLPEECQTQWEKWKEFLESSDGKQAYAHQGVEDALIVLNQNKEYYQLLSNHEFCEWKHRRFDGRYGDKEFYLRASKLCENVELYETWPWLIYEYVINGNEIPIRGFLNQQEDFVKYLFTYKKDLVEYQRKIIVEWHRYDTVKKLKLHFKKNPSYLWDSETLISRVIQENEWFGERYIRERGQELKHPTHAFPLFSVVNNDRLYNLIIPENLRDLLADKRKQYKKLMSALDEKYTSLEATSKNDLIATDNYIKAYKNFIESVRACDISTKQFNLEELAFIEKNLPKNIGENEIKFLKDIICKLGSNLVPARGDDEKKPESKPPLVKNEILANDEENKNKVDKQSTISDQPPPQKNEKKNRDSVSIFDLMDMMFMGRSVNKEKKSSSSLSTSQPRAPNV